MTRLLLLVSTLVLAFAGWHLGRGVASPRPRAFEIRMEPRPERSTPGAVTATTVSSEARPGEGLQGRIDRAVAELGPQPTGEQLALRLFPLLDDLGPEDFAALIAATENAQGPVLPGDEAAALLAGYWAERDLPAARAWLFGSPHTTQLMYLNAVVTTWQRLEPRGLWEWFVAQPQMERQRLGESIAYPLVITAGKIDPERGLELIASCFQADWQPSLARQLFETWAEEAPSAAAARALSQAVGGPRAEAIEAVARGWAQRDLAAARAWSEQLPDAILAGRALVAIGSSLATRDLPAGCDFLASLPPSETSRQAVNRAANQWCRQDRGAALAWAGGLGDEAAGRLLNEMIKELGVYDLDRAAEACTTHATRLAGHSPRADMSEGLFSVLGRLVTKREPAEIAKFVAMLPSAKLFDFPLHDTARSVFGKDPESAVRISRRISEPEAALRSVAEGFRDWSRREPAAAQQWLAQTTSLSTEERTRLDAIRTNRREP